MEISDDGRRASPFRRNSHSNTRCWRAFGGAIRPGLRAIRQAGHRGVWPFPSSSSFPKVLLKKTLHRASEGGHWSHTRRLRRAYHRLFSIEATWSGKGKDGRSVGKIVPGREIFPEPNRSPMDVSTLARICPMFDAGSGP
jgi:hypothetical protein